MNGHDRAGFLRDRCLDLCLIDIHGVRADIDKDRCRAGQYDRGGSTGEGKARDDDFVAFLKAAENRGHFQGSGAAGCQQYLLRIKALFQIGMAFFGKLPVAADLVRVDSLFYVIKFCSDIRGNIKSNHNCTSCYKNSIPESAGTVSILSDSLSFGFMKVRIYGAGPECLRAAVSGYSGVYSIPRVAHERNNSVSLEEGAGTKAGNQSRDQSRGHREGPGGRLPASPSSIRTCPRSCARQDKILFKSL